MAAKGKLILIPTIIADETQNEVIPIMVRNELPTIQHFLVENVRTARRFLSSLKIYASIEMLDFKVLDKETTRAEMAQLFRPIYDGNSIGVLSESGSPGIADPGSMAVKYAHEHEIKVVPLVGPSSIFLALMASGLNGQKFAFHGYLPIETKEREKAISEHERESALKTQTQIFIETPYRNSSLFSSLLKILKPETQLSIAMDLTGTNEFIRTLSIREWRVKSIDLAKMPAIFLFLA